MIIDTHQHCFSSKTKDCWAASRMIEFEKYNIKFVEIGINCFDIDNMIRAITKYTPCIGVVLGEHPKQITIDTDTEKIFCYVKEKVMHYKTHVLGIKTGLDYFWVEDEELRKKQRALLQFFLQYAEEQRLPIISHVRSRDDDPFCADKDMVSILSKMKYKGRIVLHCFNGTKELASKYLAINDNIYFGIGGAITFPAREKLIEAVKIIPRNRILLETDGPYMKPFYPDMARPQGKKNSSLNLPIVINKLAEVLDILPSRVEEMTAKNACEFYGLNLNILFGKNGT